MKIKKISIILAVLCCSFALFTACDKNEIKNISINTEDAFVVFEVNSEFDTTGLKVSGKQRSGANVRIPAADYTLSEVDMTTVGDKTVTVTHTATGKTATYTIKVVVLQVDVVFGGILTCGVSGGAIVLYPAELRCYNTLKWEIWTKCGTGAISGTGDRTPANINERPLRMREEGRYKVKDGVYTIVMALETSVSTEDATGAVSVYFHSPSLPWRENADGTPYSSGIFYGDLILVTA